MPISSATRPRTLHFPSSRSAETFLLDELERLLPSPLSPESIGAPVRVIVPSRSLREHLLARLAARRPAWLGLEVATARATALAILGRTGVARPRSAALFEIAVERAARDERTLARELEPFDDGLGALAGAVRDLVDAGFEPDHAEGLAERIEADGQRVPDSLRRRANALIRVAARALETSSAAGFGPEAELWRLASASLAVDADAALSVRALFIHGFDDATGRLADFLESLQRTHGASVLVVLPRDMPSAAASPFGARLRERFAGAATPETMPASDALDGGPPRVTRFACNDPALEIRAVAGDLQRRLFEGAVPERMAIVLRDPALYRDALDRELDRLGIPYSGSTAIGARGASGHRSAALLRLLSQTGDLPIDVAIAITGAGDSTPEHEIRLAARALGCDRLADAERFDQRRLEAWRGDGFPLPMSIGLEVEEGDEREHATRRRLPVEALASAMDRLAALAAEIRSRSGSRSIEEHRELLRRLFASARGREEVDEALSRAASEALAALPDSLSLARPEVVEILAEAWEPFAREPIGGAGGGVQILSAAEARGRTFETLYLPGLHRGHFPRAIAEDAMLPDDLRSRLRELLPDLPVKREGHDEERFLFASLLGAAAEVVLSRSLHDDDGRPLAPSPFVVAERPTERDVTPPSPAPLPSLLERAIRDARAGKIVALAPLLAPALVEGRSRFAPDLPALGDAVAAARLGVLAELEARRAPGASLGPFFGELGPTAIAEPVLSPTRLEGYARCGWQSFLERELRIEDVSEPDAVLRAGEASLLGRVVHGALEAIGRDALDAIGREALGASIAETNLSGAIVREGVPIAWPPEDQLRVRLGRIARFELERAGVSPVGYERLLVERAARYLDAAREADADSGIALLGVEVEGETSIALAGGGRLRLHFRVDRVALEGGRLRLVDFKTGAFPGDFAGAKPETRAKHLAERIAAGRALQVPVYVAAVDDPAAAGEYFYLAPAADAALRRVEIDAASFDRAPFVTVVSELVEARRLGLFPPRLVEPDLKKTFQGCERCRVAQACLLGDSGMRRRLEAWLMDAAATDRPRPPRPPRDTALLRHYRLGAPPPSTPRGNPR